MAYEDNGFDIGGGYGYLDPAIQSALALLQGRGYELNRGAQAGYVPTTLDPNVDYEALSRAAYARAAAKGVPYIPGTRTPQKDWWVNTMAGEVGLSPAIWSQVYDRGVASFNTTGQPLAGDAFKRVLEEAAQTATPSLASQGQKAGIGAQQAALSGYMPGQNGQQGQATLARQQAEWNAGNQLLSMAANLRGPENYFQYAQMMRNAQGSPQLAFAQQAAQGTPGAAFRAWGASPAATLPGLVGANPRVGMTPEPTTGPPPAAQPGIPAPGVPNAATQPGIPAPLPREDAYARPDVMPPAAGIGPGRFREGVQLQNQPPTTGPSQGRPGPIMTIQDWFSNAPTPTAQTPAFIQPHQANVRALNTWTPTETKMWNSALQAGMKDATGNTIAAEPEDWWEAARRAAPRGQAASATRWR